MPRIAPIILICLSMLFQMQHAHAWGKPEHPGSHAFSVVVNGLERNFIVHVPARYKPQARVPLVIMLHGGGGTAKAAMWETGWAAKADKEGFLAVFPNAMARDPTQESHFSNNPQLWNDGSERFYSDQAVVDDVAFIAALLDDLAARYAIDPRRVFLTGFSNGASMTFLAAARMPERVAAIAPVAGALWFEPERLWRPVSMLYITGTADPLNPIGGGIPKLASGGKDKVRAKSKPPVRESIRRWGRASGCVVETPIVSDAGGVRTETCACADDAEIVYIAVDGLGHTWAGGKSILPERMVGKQSNSISATSVIWEFFQKHGRSGEQQ